MKIPKEYCNMLLQVLDTFMGLMGYGRTYDEVVFVVQAMYEANPEYDFSKYYYVYKAIQKG
jgi:hypothetical protein